MLYLSILASETLKVFLITGKGSRSQLGSHTRSCRTGSLSGRAARQPARLFMAVSGATTDESERPLLGLEPSCSAPGERTFLLLVSASQGSPLVFTSEIWVIDLLPTCAEKLQFTPGKT